MASKTIKITISEHSFSTQVESLLNLFGWQWVHSRPARTAYGWRTALSGHQGFPDYIAAKLKPPRLLVFELKSEKGKVSAKQQEWLDILAQCPQVEVYVWKPAQFDEVVRILRGELT